MRELVKLIGTAVLCLSTAPQLQPARAQRVHPDIRRVVNVTGQMPGGFGWADSYSMGEHCYCDLKLGAQTFDHGIGLFMVKTPNGWKSVEAVCKMLGPGPGINGRPVYNDVQCGNGPPNDAGDEHTCPGRVDIGIEGCGHIGPKWNFSPNPFLKVAFGTDKPVDGYEVANQGNIIGSTFKYSRGLIDIVGTNQDDAYGSHMWGYGMIGYKIQVDPKERYVVKLGFAETHLKSCEWGARRFNLNVGDKERYDVDVYKQAGCMASHDIVFWDVRPPSSGELRIEIREGLSGNPYVSLIEVSYTPSSPKYTHPT